jgi:hypothetical protein
MKGDRRAEADGGTFPGRARRTPARIELSLLSRAFSPHKAPPDIARRALCCATASSSCAFGWQAESENETDKVKRAPFNQVIKPQIRPRSIAEHTVRVARNATQAGLRGRTFTHQQDSAHRARRVDEPAAAPCARDFSTSVKRKLADSKRTGQACDRCKVRTPMRQHQAILHLRALSSSN